MRMIERWFPCTEVSEASYRGWGSGNSEANLFPWFAKRPLAQARAAVLTSLLPWPVHTAEQIRLQDLVRRAMKDYNSAHNEVSAELQALGADVSMLDVFSGRAMIPLEAARYGIRAFGIEYSQVATLGGQLLADYPMRNWENEPDLPFGVGTTDLVAVRLLNDVERCPFTGGGRVTGSRHAVGVLEPLVEVEHDRRLCPMCLACLPVPGSSMS
jgi:putative DNA methylase